ncbi:MAG: hypothetical protein Ct9H90mP16_18590 [Candidatus Poseidoniales archaeon]|nr:MAG: hypothetical protein Ct9H90mP16_18590 [Candidatus Poseidoniales archaeon]
MPKSMVGKFEHLYGIPSKGVGQKRTPNPLDRLFIATHASSQHLADDDERDDGGTPPGSLFPACGACISPLRVNGFVLCGGLHWMIQWAQVVSPSCSARCSCSVLFP